MSQSPPLLQAQNARIDQRGIPLVEQLCFQADGSRIVLLGPAANAVVFAMCNEARVTSGSLHLAGRDVSRGEHFPTTGLALFDPALPPRMTVRELVARNFYLSGLSHTEAQHAAGSTLDSLNLNNLVHRAIQSLALPERRAAILAQAMLPDATILVAQSPLESLDGPSQNYVLAVLGKIAQSRSVIATAARYDTAGPERDLALGADQIVIFDATTMLWQGPPSQLFDDSPLYCLRVRGKVQRFTARLRELSCQVFDNDDRPQVRLPPGEDTTLLLRVATETESLVIELLPLFHQLHSS